METKPGSRTLFRLPDGEGRGIHIIHDKDGDPCLIMFVDSNAYVSKHPFEDYYKLEI